MDWNAVTPDDLLKALKQVSWQQPPRPVAECLTLSKLSLPKTQRKTISRIKNNIWYYRANYLIVLELACFVALIRQPLALLAVVFSTIACLLQNDSFAKSVSDRLLRLVRKANPALVHRIQNSAASSAGLGAPGGRSSGRSRSRICGIPRQYVAAALASIGVLLLWRAHAVFRLAWTLTIAWAVVLLHATVRVANLKTRLPNAQDDLRPVWRGNQAPGVVDYTL